MRRPMNVAELEALADSTGVAAETLARWHVLHWRHEPHKNAGRPRGNAKRPKGTLSVGDIVLKYGIKAATLQEWRERGLPIQRIGLMVVIEEAELRQWIRGKRGNSEKQSHSV